MVTENNIKISTYNYVFLKSCTHVVVKIIKKIFKIFTTFIELINAVSVGENNCLTWYYVTETLRRDFSTNLLLLPVLVDIGFDPGGQLVEQGALYPEVFTSGLLLSISIWRMFFKQ